MIVESVAQVQTFRFIIRTSAQEPAVQVEYSLINGVWDEYDYSQVLEDEHEYGRNLNYFPMETRPVIHVFLPQGSNQQQEESLLFQVIPPCCHIDQEDCEDND